MKRTFQQFKIGKYNFQENLLNEAEGISTSHAKFPLSFRPLTEFLTVIPGSDTIRGQILNWILSEGLMQASLGREKLLSQINEALEKEGVFANVEAPVKVEPKTLTQKPNGTQQKVVGEMALSAYDVWGSDYPHQRNIKEFLTSLDLFSPIAWERTVLPNDPSTKLLYLADEIFKKSSQYGMGILEYYKENYEPKFMVIDVADDKGSQYRYDLENIRAECEKIYGRSFHYGGFDGYIQFIEKGDWKPKIYRRAMISPNKQYGINVSPVREYDNKQKIYKNIDSSKIKVIKRNRVQYNFQGAAFTPSTENAKTAIKNMSVRFVNALTRNPNIPENDREYLNTISSLVDKMEKKEYDLSHGKGSKAEKLGFARRGPNNRDISSLPSSFDPMEFRELIWYGLLEPIQFKPNSFNPDPNNENVKSIWNSSNNTLKLNPEQAEALLNYIFKDVSFENNTGSYVAEFRLNNEVIKKILPIIEELKPNKNARINLNSIINSSVAKNPIYNKLQTAYNLKGVQYKNFAVKLNEKEIPLVGDPSEDYDPENTDPKLQKLFDNDFKWELTDDERKRNIKNPLQDENGPNKKLYAWLKHPSGVRIRVGFNPNNLKWNMYLPSPSGSKYILPAFHGQESNKPLLGGERDLFSGGHESGHVKSNTVGPKTWEEIKKRLLQGYSGGLGECEWISKGIKPKDAKKTYKQEYELPSIEEGTQLAKKWFNISKSTQLASINRDRARFEGGGNKTINYPSDIFSLDTLKKWGLEALRLHANDPAFQIGFMSQEEINRFTGHQDSRKKQLFRGMNLTGELKKQKSAIYNGLTNIHAQGKGILAILQRSINPEINYDSDIDVDKNQDEMLALIGEFVKDLVEKMKSNNEFFILQKIQDSFNQIGKSDPEVINALAYNGFQYRKRMIAKYVLEQMNKEYLTKYPPTQSTSQAKDKEGENKELDFDSQNKFYRGDYETSKEDLKVFNIEDIYNTLGIEIPKFDPSTINLPNDKVKIPKNLGPVSIGVKKGEGSSALTKKGQSLAPTGVKPANPFDLLSQTINAASLKTKPSTEPKTATQISQQTTSTLAPTGVKPANPFDLLSQTINAASLKTKPSTEPKTATQISQQTTSTLAPTGVKPANPFDLLSQTINAASLKTKSSTEPKTATQISQQTSPTLASTGVKPANPFDLLSQTINAASLKTKKCSNEHLISFLKWRKMTEMAGTSVVFDKNKSKPKSGSGFNWWGAPGNLGGTMISGEADTAKSDPDGKKGIRSGKRSK